MTFYLSNDDVHPVGVEPGEFLELPDMDASRSLPPHVHPVQGRGEPGEPAGATPAER